MVAQRSPSVPLSKSDLKAIGQVRLSKQYNKRLFLVIIPTLVIAIAGIAFHRGNTFDIGFMMVAVAMAGFLAGVIVLARWFNIAVAEFVKDHEGNFWRKDGTQD